VGRDISDVYGFSASFAQGTPSAWKELIIGGEIMNVERMQKVSLSIAFILATVFFSVPADSAIVSTTGEVSVLSAPPASVAPGGAEDNNITLVFLEQTLMLQSDLTVNNTATGAYPPNGSPGAIIPAGTTISSYFFDFDPVGTTTFRNSVGSVTFDRDILGVIFTDARLNATDCPIGAPVTRYARPEGRDVDLSANDSFTISADRRTISFDFTAQGVQDQMRVIVADDPPATSLPVASTGDARVLSVPPASVAAGGDEDNNCTRVFLEQTLTLSSDLTVDNTAAGKYPPNGSPGVVIPAGTTIESYFFDFDPVGTACCPNSVGSIRFDGDILGVIFTASRLDETDDPLAYSGTDYSPTEGREVNTGSNDTFTISSDRRTISFNFTADTGQDQMRVILDAGVENEPPVAVNDAYSVAEDMVLTVAAPGVLGNDTDADGDALEALLGSEPARGTLILNADGSFTYTPDANFTGTDQFTYQASDGELTSDPATVTLTVSAGTNAPVAQDDAYAATEDTPLTVPAPGVLANDTDPDGDTLTAVQVSPPQHGTLTLNPDGSFTYTPDPGFTGPDTFTYRASDGALTSNTATVTLTVTPEPNRAPVAVDDAYSVTENATLTVPAPGVLANDTDPDGDTLMAALVSPPQHGDLTLNPDGSFTYTPDPGFTGPDTFTYRASDGTLTDDATVTLTVTAGAADLAVTLTDMPDPVRRGRELTYTATVHNDGPHNALDVALTLKLTGSAILVNIQGDVNPDTDCTITYKGSSSFPLLASLTCNLGDFPSGAEGTLVVTVQPTKAETLTAMASVAASSPGDPDPTDNTKTATTTVTR
jgi:VCBS repeat-containing protein